MLHHFSVNVAVGSCLLKNCLTACTTDETSHLEVSSGAEVLALSAILSGFWVHFLWPGECSDPGSFFFLFHLFSLAALFGFSIPHLLLWILCSVWPR